MTYPNSSPVSSGQPTSAAHYNTLRQDAIRLGQLDTDAATMGDLLSAYETGLNLSYLATNRIRVLASPTLPVCIIINRTPLYAIANIDLPNTSAPSGAASDYYIFAIRSANSTAFSLSINTTPTEWTDARRIGQFYWDGSKIVKDSIRSEYRSYLTALLKYGPPQGCQGRLTLASNIPVTTTTVNSGTLYFTPYGGKMIDLFAPGFGWVPYSFAEMNISLAGKATGLNFDVFTFDNGSTLELELIQWAGDNTRNTALYWQDGIPLKYGDLEKRYLGSVRTSADSTLTDQPSKRFVWNMYNRRPRPLLSLAGASHTYTSATYRPYNNDTTTCRLEILQGLIEDCIIVAGNNGGNSGDCDITASINSPTAINGGDKLYSWPYSGAYRTATGTAFMPLLGYNYVQLLETSRATCTLVGAYFTGSFPA